MPPLSNPKHERFAQELAKGSETGAAYVSAGFSPNPGNARRLKQNEAVVKRIEALLSERSRVHEKGLERAIERVALTKEWVIQNLIENAGLAKQAGDFGPSNQALNLLGKELGMFIDRSENVNVNHVVSGDLPTEDEWANEHATAH